MKSLETFYGECINSKIRHSELKAQKINAVSRCIKQRAEIGRAQAMFFEDQKERLVREMVKQNLGKDLIKISAFLTRSFVDSLLARSAHAPLPENGESIAFDHGSLRDVGREPSPLSLNYSFSQGRIESLFEDPWSGGFLIDDED